MLSNAAKLFLVLVSAIAIVYPLVFTAQFYFLVKRVERIEEQQKEAEHDRLHNKRV